MQASELPRKIICCQQRIVLVAETQTSHLPKKNIFCQQRFALTTARQACYLPKKNICCQQRIVLAAATQASEPLKDLKTCDLNKASTTTKTLLREII
ncbi:MAG: hypothetical protein HXO04_03125 [Prevotella salivae]|uniref:hypothetical protein n=1 Tax=Segatella salivae TaxID=228604 RepID=UPI001CAAF5F6|nr:hypothetical protein [Segatella salivae]MBF1548516.1 hypothetical protein [Segatella salivae]